MSDKAKIIILILLNVALLLKYLNTSQNCLPNYVTENLAQYRNIAENLILARDLSCRNETVLEEMNRKPGYCNILSKVNSKMKLRGFTLTSDNKVYLRLDMSSNFLRGEWIEETLIYSNHKIHPDSEENTEVKEICRVQIDSVMLYRREKGFD